MIKAQNVMCVGCSMYSSEILMQNLVQIPVETEQFEDQDINGILRN